MFKENSKKVFYYVKENENEKITANDIAEALGLGVKQVNGIVTRAFQMKGYMERVRGNVTLDDGTLKEVKFIHLTDEGRDLDVEADDTVAE